MKKQEFRPEGIVDAADASYLGSIKGLLRAKNEGKILQSKCVMCDTEHNLHLNIGDVEGIIPREEVAIGIKENTTKDVAIITRVNKNVCFKVRDVVEKDNKVTAYLSRKDAQLEFENNIFSIIKPGDIIDAKVTHLEQFGAFVDIGCGVISMIPIDSISVSRIEHPKNRFYPGMQIKAVVKSVDYDERRINLSHKELLGTWTENSSRFRAGETVSGIVRSIENYGIFIELAPNLAGLAELTPDISVGSKVSVYIKSIIPEKMKIKLAVVESIPDQTEFEEFEYFYSDNYIEKWRYSPDCCPKIVESIFMQPVK